MHVTEQPSSLKFMENLKNLNGQETRARCALDTIMRNSPFLNLSSNGVSPGAADVQTGVGAMARRWTEGTPGMGLEIHYPNYASAGAAAKASTHHGVDYFVGEHGLM